MEDQQQQSMSVCDTLVVPSKVLMDSGSVWQGQGVRLRTVEPSDADAHFVWNQDSQMMRQLDHVPFPQSREATKQVTRNLAWSVERDSGVKACRTYDHVLRSWAEKAAAADGKDDAFHFEIETHAGELVGVIGTHGCDPRNGTFAYGVAIRVEHQRQGYASDAIRVVLRHYFDELRYQKVTVRVYSFNDASIRLHERLGFQREGRLRRMVYTRGQFFDELVFGLTSDEFAARPAG